MTSTTHSKRAPGPADDSGGGLVMFIVFTAAAGDRRSRPTLAIGGSSLRGSSANGNRGGDGAVRTLMPHTIVPAQQDTQERLHGTSRARRADDRMLQAVIRLIHQGPADRIRSARRQPTPSAVAARGRANAAR